MIWQNDELASPFSGKLLRRDSPHSFSDGAQRFPIVAEIPFLRAGREALIGEVLRALDSRDEREALVLLLQEQDDWAPDPPPSADELQPLFESNDLTLREAMRHLHYGAVADYFAYRWSDPTFLSGLKLLESHLPPNAQSVFELCCGIGHYLREFELRGIRATGADVVFSKLWLARKFVAPSARLVCFDANFDFPIVEKFDAAFCHDAFYFLPGKAHIAAELKRLAAGAVLIGHAHNAEAENFSSGAAATAREYAALFEDAAFYDDAELTAAFIENRQPKARGIEGLRKSEALAFALSAVQQNAFDFSLPPAARALRTNPLLDTKDQTLRAEPQYPSARYAAEYGALSNYLHAAGEKITSQEWEKLRAGNWAGEPRLRELVRRRIFLDLPEKW